VSLATISCDAGAARMTALVTMTSSERAGRDDLSGVIIGRAFHSFKRETTQARNRQ
jgi:hypothetical protein